MSLNDEKKLQLNQLLEASPYRAVSSLGRGAAAEVFVVRHEHLRKKFALKALHRHLAEESDFVERLRREARALARVNSPHIVQVVDLARATDGTPYLVLELMRGHSLAQELMQRRALPFAEALEWARQCLMGLQAAHMVGITHRDITPNNLFLQQRTGYDRILKILDFGLVRLLPGAPAADLNDPMVSATSTGTMVGSPAYASPEAFRGERLDHRADLYGVGLVLFEMLTGLGPFDYDGPGLPHLSSLRPDFPPGLDELLQQCTQQDPDERFQSVSALLSALESVTSKEIQP